MNHQGHEGTPRNPRLDDFVFLVIQGAAVSVSADRASRQNELSLLECGGVRSR